MKVVIYWTIAVAVLVALGTDANRRPRARSRQHAAALIPLASSDLESLPTDVLREILDRITEQPSVSAMNSVSRLFRYHLRLTNMVSNLFVVARWANKHPKAFADKIRFVLNRAATLPKSPLPDGLISYSQALVFFDALRSSKLCISKKIAALRLLVPVVGVLRDVLIAFDVNEDSPEFISGVAEILSEAKPSMPTLNKFWSLVISKIASKCPVNDIHRLDEDTVSKIQAIYHPQHANIFPNNAFVAGLLFTFMRRSGYLPRIVHAPALRILAQLGIRFCPRTFLHAVRLRPDQVAELYPLLRRPNPANVRQDLRPLLTSLLASTQDREPTVLALLDLDDVRAALATFRDARIDVLNAAIRHQRRQVLAKLLSQPDIHTIINGIPSRRLPLAVAFQTGKEVVEAILKVPSLDFDAMKRVSGRSALSYMPVGVDVLKALLDLPAEQLAAAVRTDPGLFLRRLLLQFPSEPDLVQTTFQMPIMKEFVNSVVDESNQSALHIAFQRYLTLVPILLQIEGINVRQRDLSGRVAFSYLHILPSDTSQFFRSLPADALASLVTSDMDRLFALLNELATYEHEAQLRDIFSLSFWSDIRNIGHALIDIAFARRQLALVRYLLLSA